MAEKKEMKERVKSLWIKGMKAVGNTAASIANNTRYKVDEVTIQNRRREVLNDLAHRTYALWLKGEEFPEPMAKMLLELKALDEQMNDMRAEKYASSGKTIRTETEESAPVCVEKDTEEEEDEPDSVPADSQVSAEINELFDGASSVGKTAEKVNQSLDQLSERIRQFPQGSETQENE